MWKIIYAVEAHFYSHFFWPEQKLSCSLPFSKEPQICFSRSEAEKTGFDCICCFAA